MTGAVFSSPFETSPITLSRRSIPALKHERDDQAYDQGRLKKPKEGLDETLIHDNQGAHPQARGHGRYDEDHLLPGETHKDEAVMEMILVDAGQKFQRVPGKAVLEP